MPQPSRCGPVRPPRCISPVKLKTISVGTLALMPNNSHMPGFSIAERTTLKARFDPHTADRGRTTVTLIGEGLVIFRLGSSGCRSGGGLLLTTNPGGAFDGPADQRKHQVHAER